MTERQRDIDLIYRENILDHYRRPRNFGRLDGTDRSRHEANFSCGDDVTMHVRLGTRGRVAAVSFEGQGCAVSMAAASMLTEKAVGATSAQIAKWGLPEISELLGVEIGPGRERCASLALTALQRLLAEDAKGKKGN